MTTVCSDSENKSIELKKNPSEQVIPLLLLIQAKSNPHKKAYSFLEKGKEKHTLTYKELHQRALTIAKTIKQHAKVGDRVVLLYQPGLAFIEAFYGCLYAGVIPAPAYPPNPKKLNSSIRQLNALLNDAEPALILCSSLIHVLLKSINAKDKVQTVFQMKNNDNASVANNFSIINSQKIATQYDLDASIMYVPQSDNIAYLQYTSGSTGHPKGVMITYKNISETMLTDDRSCDLMGIENNGPAVTWVPHQHDFCLIAFILRSLVKAYPLYLISPLEFMMNPKSWLQALSDYKAVHTAAPSFAYDYAMKACDQTFIDNLDLSHMIVAINGGMNVDATVMQNFSDTFKKAGFKSSAFFPGYGMAESTLYISGIKSSQKSRLLKKSDIADKIEACEFPVNIAQDVVSVGRWDALHELLIVNPESKEPVTGGMPGEIWFRGPTVAKGYWGHPEKTKEVFHAFTAAGEGPFLRTGDLGMVDNKELYIIGRIKDLVIIRGRNYVPDGIENTIMGQLQNKDIQSVACFSYLENGDESLIVVLELAKKYKTNTAELLADIQKTIHQSFDLFAKDILILSSGALPRTVSGKVQRQLLKKYYQEHGFQKNKYLVLRKDAVQNKRDNVAVNRENQGEIISTPLFVGIKERVVSLLLETFDDLGDINFSGDVCFHDLNVDSLSFASFIGKVCEEFDIDIVAYHESTGEDAFVEDKTLIDVCMTLYQIKRHQNIAPSSIKSELRLPAVINHKQKKSNTLLNKLMAKIVVKKVFYNSYRLSKNITPLERCLYSTVKRYVMRYLPHKSKEYEESVIQSTAALIHQQSLYASFTGWKSDSIKSRLMGLCQKKAIAFAKSENVAVIEKIINVTGPKMIFFMHSPSDFGAAFILLQMLDDCGIKTGVLVRELGYEENGGPTQLKHSVSWDLCKKNGALGVAKMIKEERIIFIAPDSFHAVYTNNYNRFNLTNMFPDLVQGIGNPVLKDLVQKDFFMYIEEMHQLAYSHKMAILPLIGKPGKNCLTVDIGSPVKVQSVENNDYSQFVYNVLKDKAKFLINDLTLHNTIYDTMNYYAWSADPMKNQL